MNDHETFRELAALRLYDELDAVERARLEKHLASCAACAQHARELEAGLGRLVRAPGGDDLPTGWRERLEQGLGLESRRRALRSPLWIAAAAFLAGASLSWAVAAPGKDAGGAREPVAGLEAPAGGGGFERSTPPPRARDRGPLPLLELYLRR